MAGSLLKKWGLGVDLFFDAGSATAKMSRVGRAAGELKGRFKEIGPALSGLGANLASFGAALAPLALGFGLIVGQGSQLAADLEAQSLTMRVMLGDAAKAEQLISLIRANAAATPFEEGDLIEGSKRLLRLTGSNVDRNMELLKVMETMAALSPGKSVVEAVEGLLDATSGGGFERLKEFGLSFRAEDFEKAGRPGGEAWANAVIEAMKERMNQLTKGEDLVGALSQTFTGRLSTLKDSFNGLARTIGEELNQRLGPALEPFSNRIMGLGGAVKIAAKEVGDSVDRLVARLRPRFARLLAWWDALGEEGQGKVIGMALKIAALASVALPAAGAIGAVGFAVISLISSLASLVEVGMAVGGTLAAALAPELLIPAALALALVATWAGLLFAVFREEGEGPIAFVMRLGRLIKGELLAAFDSARAAWGAFSHGFLLMFEGFGPLVAQVTPAVRGLWTTFSDLWAMVAGEGVSLKSWFELGGLLGQIANIALRQVASGIQLATSLVSVLLTTLGPLVVTLRVAFGGLVDLVTGASTARSAIGRMAWGIMHILTALITGLFSLVIGAIEVILREVITLVSGIPGFGAWAAKTGTSMADALSFARQEVEKSALKAITGVDVASSKRDSEAAAATAPTVNVAPATVENKVVTEAVVKVDGAEIARATGRDAVKKGQRSGRDLPAEARGKVIRGGGVLGVLRPAEVL